MSLSSQRLVIADELKGKEEEMKKHLCTARSGRGKNITH